MTKNKIILYFGGVLVVSIIIIYFAFLTPRKTIIAPAIKAVPSDASILVEAKDIKNLFQYFNKENKIWEELIKIHSLENLNQDIDLIIKSIKENSELETLLSDKDFIFSVHQKGKEKLDYLFVFAFPDKTQMTELFNIFKKISNSKFKIKEKIYNEVKLYEAEYEENRAKNFSFSHTNGVLLLSFSPILIEESIRQLDTGSSLLNNEDFRKVSETAGKNVDANIYINYKNFARQTLNYLNKKNKDLAFSLENFGNWTEADVKLKENSMSFNGFTYSSNEENNYLNLFLQQSPISLEIENVLPLSTSSFLVLGIDDLAVFKKNYYEYMKIGGQIHQYNHHLKKIKADFNVDIEKMFYSVLSNEIALVFTDLKSPEIERNAFALFKLNDREEAEKKFMSILTKYADLKDVEINSFTNPFTIGEQSHMIYQMPIVNILQKLFGGLYGKVRPKYFTYIDDYIIFGSSIFALKAYLRDIVLERTLSKSTNYKKFTNSLSSQSNIYFYTNIPKSLRLYNMIFERKLQELFDEYYHVLQNFEALAVQFSSGKELIYNNVFLKYNPTKKIASNTRWECPIKGNVVGKPQLVKNHYTEEKEIFIQDANNNIYLIAPNGKIIWSREIDGQILSKITQIDYYKNNKLQLLFNTRYKLYLIDRKGKDVEKYPISLKSPATNGISVFDYNDDKTYRIFVATEDKKVRLYKKNGTINTGWTFEKTNSNVYSEIQFIRDKDKDYIVFSDETQTYILNRKGKTRINLKKNFVKSQNNKFFYEKISKTKARMVTTNQQGLVMFVYFDGEVTNMSFGDYTGVHYFDYADIDKDGFNDFVFVDRNKLKAIAKNKETIYEYTFDNNIVINPRLYSFSNKEKKIGITDKTANKIYLLNSDGSIYKSFPLVGSTAFSMGYLKKTNNNFNLIVGNNANSLYNYEIY